MQPADDAPAERAAPVAAVAPAAPAVAMRASDQDRDAVVQRLQEAFADGSLDDEEFDRRTRAALTARLHSELAVLTQDLRSSTGLARPVAPVTAGRTPGRFALAYKSSIRRGGRWRVPEQFRTVVYKGSGLIDLRAAELTSPVTTLYAIAYKSRIDVLVPLGVRVELDGFGVSKGWSAEEDLESRLPADAPVVHVRGIGYKGTVEVSTKPQGPGQRRLSPAAQPDSNPAAQSDLGPSTQRYLRPADQADSSPAAQRSLPI
jgi:Domain of unknown function (DUF1707)